MHHIKIIVLLYVCLIQKEKASPKPLMSEKVFFTVFGLLVGPKANAGDMPAVNNEGKIINPPPPAIASTKPAKKPTIMNSP